MVTNHTENYELNLWEPEDAVLRTDFNADNEKLEAALTRQAEALSAKADASALAELAAGTLRIETGVYWGDDKPTRKLKLPFKAKFVWIQENETGVDNHLVLMVPNFCFYQAGKTPLTMNRGDGIEVEAKDDGVVITVSRSDSAAELARIALNRRSSAYIYVAIG